MDDQDRDHLDAFAAKLTTALDLETLPLDIDQVLNLAGVAARSIVRPAAPLTTFLVGYSAGRAAAGGADPAAAIAAAVATATDTAAASAGAE